MKAALLRKVGKIETSPLEVGEIETPKPGKSQVLLRVEACGVCRSNLHMVEGEWVSMGIPTKYPMVPGHEIAGTISEVGPDVEGYKKNEKVGISPLWVSCGGCEYCLTGREQLCAERRITGEEVDGGYAEFMLGNSDYLFRLPSNLRPESAAALFCPGVTAYSAVKKAKIEPGKKVAVFGIGGVGHMALQFAKLGGGEVYAVTRGDNHLRLSEELGAIAIDANKDPVGALTKLGGVDYSIVFAPSSRVAEQAIRATKRGGTIVMGAWGGFADYPFYDEKTILGTLMGSRQVMREVLQLAGAGKVEPVTEKFRLDEANAVLQKLKVGEIKARAVLIP